MKAGSTLKWHSGWLAGAIVVIGLLAGNCPAADVPYVPTPQETVLEMLNLAGVTESDLVYDLGSGDGRIAITAAQMGASAVGIDIDPERIRESNANAAAAGVTDRVVFHQQDLFEANISDATVVTLYLLPSVNLRLRPKLLQELRPGTRVVSHSFDMGDWEPDLQLEDGREIYLWIVPANLTGTWSWTDNSGARVEMVTDQHFQDLTGTLSRGGKMEPIHGAVLVGDTVKIAVERNLGGSKELVLYQGRVNGQGIEGTESSSAGELPWSAKREPGTETNLDDGTETGFISSSLSSSRL